MLTELGEQYDVKVHVVRRDGLDTVAQFGEQSGDLLPVHDDKKVVASISVGTHD